MLLLYVCMTYSDGWYSVSAFLAT